MKIIKVHKHFLGGDTDVTLDVPEFENFGRRMKELETLAYEADPIDPAEVQASTAKMMAQMEELQEKARQKLDATPAGPKKAMDAVMLGLLQGMAQGVRESQAEPEDSDEPEEDAEAEQPEPLDLQRLELSVPKGMKWNAKNQALVEQFLADWPQTRVVVLQAVFDYYKRNYAGLLTLFRSGDKGLRFILPEPSSPGAIADLFYFSGMHLHPDGATGLSGNCTWEMEHGFGLRLKSGRVTDIGVADVAFC